jgi:hypothetical protein
VGVRSPIYLQFQNVFLELPMSTGLRETARQIGKSHAYLSRMAKARRVPRNPDGTFDVEAVRKALKAFTDPSKVRHRKPAQSGSRTTGGVPEGYHAIFKIKEPFSAGMAYATLRVIYAIGAHAACVSVAAGASIDVARKAQDMMTFAVLEWAAEAGLFSTIRDDENLFDLDAFDQVNWPGLEEVAAEAQA